MSEEESDVPAPDRSWPLLTLVHAVLVLMVFARLLMAGPRISRTYADLSMRLPAASEMFVGLSVWMESSRVAAIVTLAIALVLDGFLLWLLGGWSRFEGQLYFLVIVVLLLLVWGLEEGSFYLADLKVREGLRRRGA